MGLAIPHSRLPLFCCLIAFILTFLATRTIVRYIRRHADSDAPRRWWQPRNISGSGGVRIHHVVIGVILVMVSGVTMVTLAVEGGVPEFKLWTGLVGMFTTPLLVIGAIRLPRPRDSSGACAPERVPVR